MSDVFTEPAPEVPLETLRATLSRHWALTDAVLHRLDSERDLNVRVGDRYVLKVTNPAESADVVAMESAALAHASAADPGLPVPALVPGAGGVPMVTLTDRAGRACLTRLITLLPGRPLEGEPVGPGLAAQVGAIAARTSVALQGFFHPAAGRELVWDVRRLPAVVAAAGDASLAELTARVRPALDATATLPAGVQHGDVTLTNVLADAGTVTGVIDFGDLHHTAAVCDLAATLTSVLRQVHDEADLWRLAEAVLRGYQRHRPLDPAEVAVLGELVIARLLTTVAVSANRRDRHSANRPYITQYDTNSNRVLGLVAALPPGELADRLHRLAGARDLAAPAPGLGERRAAAMGGPLAPLFYREPVEIVRGDGPWLFTRDGTRYLDAYNNVAVVGHAHPAVTNAVARQLSTLNTHSRYLHPAIVALAERILATMPEPLDTCLFTTSGTEANELAWRLATAHTGNDGAIVAERAYHGSSHWMADLSSNEWPPGHRPRGVATFAAPRGPDLAHATACRRVEDAASALRVQGRPPALLLADSQFTSEGILDAPPEFMAGLVDGAHRAGALFLADEVQAGYGRSGPQLWRFPLAGIAPDIVTLGKPMGAGYPIGAVVTRREIADALAERYEYFSTFAATPAAAAAGHAVLDVLELTGLPAQGVEVGEHLRRRLTELAAGEPALGEVRGTGLIAGVDLRGDPRSVPDRLAAQGVLAGTTGPGGAVLKIRPPLVWTTWHADLFVERLGRALSAE